jgi:hypothetical protein
MQWASMGLLLNVFSALGPFSLAYIMASKNILQNFYSASIYFYLHFQYNGWFFFAAMALALNLLPPNVLPLKQYFRIFAIAAVLTYGLSILWLKLPLWLHSIVAFSALIQLITWSLLVIKFFKTIKNRQSDSYIRLLFYAAALALTIKFILQAVSVIPSLSQWAFRFKPIVIAYLHLALLGVFSFFILGYGIKMSWLKLNNAARITLAGFVTGVIINELLLVLQGIASFTSIFIPYINEMLLATALVLLASSAGLFISQLRRSAKHRHPS